MNATTISRLSLIVFLFIFTYFLYVGFTTQPWEGDSLGYHIPIAKSILNGTVFNPSKEGYALGFYPGSSEVILSIFILLGIPLNLYNVLGWVLLFFLTKRLGSVFGARQDLTLIFAAGIALLPSVIRLIPTQTIDIWLAVFFIESVILLETPKNTNWYFLKLGFVLGMLIGTKYSGLLFAFVLLIVYARKLIFYINFKRGLVFITPLLIFGLSWYVRNYFLTGNPFYPASIFIWQGKESFKLLNWQPWKTILFYPNGLFLMIQSLISEFLFWGISLIIAPFLLIYARYKKIISFSLIKLVLLCFLNFIIYLLLPSWPENIVSDLRYTYPAIIPLILVLFLIAQRFKKIELISGVAFLNMVLVLPQLDYHPKLFLIFVLIVILAYPRLECLFKRL